MWTGPPRKWNEVNWSTLSQTWRSLYILNWIICGKETKSPIARTATRISFRSSGVCGSCVVCLTICTGSRTSKLNSEERNVDIICHRHYLSSSGAICFCWHHCHWSRCLPIREFSGNCWPINQINHPPPTTTSAAHRPKPQNLGSPLWRGGDKHSFPADEQSHKYLLVVGRQSSKSSVEVLKFCSDCWIWQEWLQYSALTDSVGLC